MRRKTVVVRINQEVFNRAIEEKPKNIAYMDAKELLSYLIVKGLEKVKEEERKKCLDSSG